jgi:hypothetical protein
MKKGTEIKKVQDYCWGSVVTVIEEDQERLVVTVRAGYLAGAFITTNLVFIISGFLLGRL